MSLTVCSRPGCASLTSSGRCDGCKREAEQARGSASQRGYGSRHRDRFRKGTLAKDPVCVLCMTAPSTVADHHPLDRRELVQQGLDPNDPQHGRGLCKRCHDRSTSERQPGGWNAR
jgi:5-methylcytosine-specific restriction protein A